MPLDFPWRKRRLPHSVRSSAHHVRPSCVESLESRRLLATSQLSVEPPPLELTADDDAQSYTSFNYGANGGIGLGPATFLEGGPDGALFLAPNIDGGKSFGMFPGTQGQAFTRSLDKPATAGEYSFSVEFGVDLINNGFAGFSIKSARGDDFEDNEILSFGLDYTQTTIPTDPTDPTPAEPFTTITINGAIEETLGLGEDVRGQTVDFKLAFDTSAGSYTLSARVRPTATFTSVSGGLKTIGLPVTHLGFGDFNLGTTNRIFFDNLKMEARPSTYRVNESGVFAIVQVSRRGGDFTNTATVNYTTVDGTGKAGSDYVATSGLLFFSGGTEETKDIVIPLIDDSSVEGDETFFIQLSDPNLIPDDPTQPIPETVVLGQVLATVTVIDNDVTLRFLQSSYEAFVHDNVAVITVQREGRLDESVTVDWTTEQGTAKPGVDYGTLGDPAELFGAAGDAAHPPLTFAIGQSAATIQIPLIDAGALGDKSFKIKLSNAASSSNETEAFIVVGNVERQVTLHNVDISGPVVTGISLNTNRPGGAGRIKSITVQFNEPLNQGGAQSVSSYGLFARSGSGDAFGSGSRKPIALKGAVYDNASNSVILVPKAGGGLAPNQMYQLVVLANSALTDKSFRPLDADPSTPAADNFSAFFARGKQITYLDAQGDKVKLKLAGPGAMELIRKANGDAQKLTLVATTGAKSVLSGNVTFGPPNGNAVTTIDLLFSGGAFENQLTNPPFSITQSIVPT